MRKVVKNKTVVRSTVLLLICVLIFSGTALVYASDGFGKHDRDFTLADDGIDGSSTDTYPYSRLLDEVNPLNQSDIQKVGLDLLYGTQRDLLVYFGEIPYAESHDKDGDKLDKFSGYYSVDNTSIMGNNPSNYSILPFVSSEDYWGAGIKFEGDKLSLDALEKVNENEVVSLRLYALSNSPSMIMHWITNAFYMLQLRIAGLGTRIVNLIILAKNIDMNDIIEMLGLEQLSNSLTSVFIRDGQTHNISFLAGFCIIIFMLSLVGYVISYVKGQTAAIGVKDILIPAFVGLLIIGACLSGRVYTLGSTLANGVNKVLYGIAASMTDDGSSGTGVFITTVNDPANDNRIVQIQEMSLLNKCYIDLQLCTQFRVDDVSEMDVVTLGDKDANLAKNYLSGVRDVDFSSNFGNNLGYYFWFANSSAMQKTNMNASFPETNPSRTEPKLHSMITYLQVLYNKGDASQKDTIRTIMLGMSRPTTGQGFLRMLLFTVILVMLALCLWRYALAVMVAKLQMMLSLVGMTIAGPLMVTGKEKLVNTGKDILSLILVSFVEISIYSVFFDLILYLTSIIVGPSLLRLIVTFILLILLWKFNLVLVDKIKELMKRMEHRMMSNGSVIAGGKMRLANATRNAAHRGMGNITEKWDNSGRILRDEEGNVIRDADGNPVREKRKGGLVSQFLHQADNTFLTDSRTHKKSGKIRAEDQAARRKIEEQSKNTILTAADKEVANIEQEVREEAERKANKMETQIHKNKVEYEKDPDAKYTAVEKELKERIEVAAAKSEALAETREKIVKDLEAQEALRREAEAKGALSDADRVAYEEFSKENREKITNIEEEIRSINQEVDLNKKTLEESLDTRAKNEAATYLHSIGDLTDADMQGMATMQDIDKGLRLSAQEAHKDELAHALQKQAATCDKEAANLVKDPNAKIGAKKKVDRTKVEMANASRLRYDELINGVLMDNMAEARKAVADVSEEVASNNEFKLQHSEDLAEASRERHAVKSVSEKIDEGLEGKSRVRKVVGAFNPVRGVAAAASNVKDKAKADAKIVKAGAVAAAQDVVSAANFAFETDMATQNKEAMKTVSAQRIAEKQASMYGPAIAEAASARASSRPQPTKPQPAPAQPQPKTTAQAKPQPQAQPAKPQPTQSARPQPTQPTRVDTTPVAPVPDGHEVVERTVNPGGTYTQVTRPETRAERAQPKPEQPQQPQPQRREERVTPQPQTRPEPMSKSEPTGFDRKAASRAQVERELKDLDYGGSAETRSGANRRENEDILRHSSQPINREPSSDDYDEFIRRSEDKNKQK